MQRAMWALATVLTCLALWCAGCGGGGGSAVPGPVIDDGSPPPPGQVVRTIDGRLVNGLGEPVAGATVGLPSKSRQGGVKTDQSGHFVLVVRVLTTATSLTLEIVMPFGSTGQSVVDLPAGQTTTRPVVVAVPGATPAGANAPPVITSANVDPPVVDVSGGLLRLSAKVTDGDSPDLTVVALVWDGEQVTPALLDYHAGTYIRNVDMPANLGSDETDRTCEVWFCATDAPRGSCRSVTAGPFSVVLKGMPKPPALPAELN